MRARTIIALCKRLEGGERLRLRVVSMLVIALGSAALLVGPGIEPTARAQTPVDYDGDDDGLIEVATVAQLNAIRWDLNGGGDVDPSGDASGYSAAFPNAMASMGCATGCTGYELTADLDLLTAGDSVTGWEPIGGMSGAFTATFDGGAPGFTVRNLTISNSSLERVGLFSATGPGSVIRNVTLEDVNVTGHTATGALVGRNSGSIIDNRATGAVSGAQDTGGLIGQSVQPGSVIAGSAAGVRVTGTDEGLYTGGLVGWNAGPIIDSHATGDVSGVKWVGGLVGSNSGAGGVNRISGSTASGAVTGTGDLVGGLVGWNNGPIIDSHATGDVSGVKWVGGLVGSNYEAGGTYQESRIYKYGGVNKISGSTASGVVTGTSEFVGGLVGWNNGPISSSRATGDVYGMQRVGGLVGSNTGVQGVNRISGSTAGGAVTGTGNFVGGLAGRNDGPISDSHATGDVDGVHSVGGLVGTNFDDGGYYGDVVGLNAIRGSTASGVVIGTGVQVGGLVGYNEGPISDSDARGSLVRGYSSVGGLVGKNDGPGPISDSHARGSVQSLNLSGGLVGWNRGSITDSSASGDVVEPPFSTGLTFGGLVGLNDGVTSEGAVIRSSATGDVTSSGNTVGGLVGRNVEGTITESVASGAVTGPSQVGGLVGHDRGVSSGDSIVASRASGNVTGSGESVGGLVGWAEGTIRTSYATGAVSGAESVGGLAGLLQGAVITSYASGDVSGSGNAVGGLVGQSDSGNSTTPTASSVLASYATGSVSGGAANLGGLIGVAQAPTGTYPSPSFTDSYWDTERSSRSIGVGSDDVDADGSINGSETATSGVTGQTTSALQMPTGYTGIYANWNIAAGDPWDFGGGTDDPELRAPPNASPAFSSTAVLLTVAEDAAVGSNVGAAVTATDSDTLAYKLVGAGSAAFDIVSATGQLQVGAALDHETDGSYTVTVQASDGRSVAFKDVTVTVTGVDEPPALSGDDAPAVADDGAVFVSTYTVADPEGDAVGAITWSLAGADSSSFTIEDGRLSFRATPDYEDPNHAAGYDVTVQAAVAGQSSPLTLAVTATVVNIDEAGVVSLSTAQPEDDVALTATLSDLDGGVSGLTWRWRRATTTDGPWTTILGRRARSDTYTPDRNDAGHYLQVTASYSDAEGPMKSAQAITDNPMGMATPRVIVSPTELSVNEGRSRTYAVALNTQPSGDVMVAISSDNTDVTVNPANLTFTTANWETAQTVTVSAAEDYDALQDTATVTHDPSGADYDSVSNADLPITVPENDSLGVTAWPRSLRVSEGGSNTYTVSLDTQPTGDVTVTISSDNPDVTVSPSILTFTTTDWGTRQRVTITAGRDGDAADDMATLTHDPSGADYDSVSNADIAVTVTDYDIPGVTVSPTWLPVNEGSTNTYTVVLDTLPSGDVSVAISSDNTDVTVSSPSLTFTTANWDTAQTVTVSAAPDADLDDDTATVTHEPSGADYNSVSNADLAVTVGDRDAPGVTVDPLSLTVIEGGSSTYTVRLNTQPSGDVTVSINSGRKVTVSPSDLTFTTTNWGAAQTVTVSAAEDYDRLQDTVQVVNSASGADYDSVSALDQTVTIIDNDTPGVTVTPTSLTVGEGGSGTYTVALDTLPSGDVTVAISSDNADVTADPASLTFSTSNWATPQTVTVSAAEDEDRLQDTAMVTHDPSGADYDSVSNADLAVTVIDNDMPGVTVTPTSLTVAEGGTNTYTVVLDAQPSDEVTVTIVDPTDNTDVTANPASLTFSTTDWATAQTVTVSAAEDNDPLQDTATVTHTVAGGDYDSITAQDVAVTVTDNDTPGVTVSPMSLTVNEGSTDTYTVKLNTQPSGDVMVAISSNNTDVTVSSSSLTFTTTTWSAEQTVTVTAGQDADADNDTATVTHDPSGADYDSVSNADLAVTVTDNDTPGVTVEPTSLTVGEGGSGTYTVVLDTLPSGDVMVNISSDNADVTVSSSSLTFTTTTWSAAQTVTVTAGQDADADNDTAMVTHNPSGADYNSVSNADLAVTVTDNDMPGVTVTPTSLTVGEGGSGTYTVALNTQPSGDVTVTIVDPTDNADVTAEPAALTFTTANWNSAQTVTVSADQDADMDDETVTVTHTVSGYDSVVTAASVTVTVTEDPTAPYDTDGNGAIDKSEAIATARGYLTGGTASKEVAIAVVRRYLLSRN